MSEMKVATEVAEAEFERFADAMALDIDPKGMDADDTKSFRDQKRIIILSMERGDLVVNPNGEPVFTPTQEQSGRGPITFREVQGKDFTKTDSKKPNENVGKNISAMAAATGQAEARYEKMAQRDLKVCNAIFQLLIG